MQWRLSKEKRFKGKFLSLISNRMLSKNIRVPIALPARFAVMTVANCAAHVVM